MMFDWISNCKATLFSKNCFKTSPYRWNLSSTTSRARPEKGYHVFIIKDWQRLFKDYCVFIKRTFANLPWCCNCQCKPLHTCNNCFRKPNKSMQKIKVCRRSKYAEYQSMQKRILKRARALLGSLSTAKDLPKAILPALPTPSTLPCL